MLSAVLVVAIAVTLLAQVVLFSLSQQLRALIHAFAPARENSYFASTDFVLWQFRPLLCGLRFLPFFKPAPPELSQSPEFALYLGQIRIAAVVAGLGYVFAAASALLSLTRLVGG